MTLSKKIKEFRVTLEEILDRGISLSSKFDVTDFKQAKIRYLVDRYNKQLKEFHEFGVSDQLPSQATELCLKLKKGDPEQNLRLLGKLEPFGNIKLSKDGKKIQLHKIPPEIREEVKADLDELHKCFEHECYRSCVILCGRIIEVCLHAKYYKVTGFDILEKNPGIGLGKLLAKMDEKGIKLDPGLAQQIHLVNNIRIFSVHKKQRSFSPTKQQTEAIILYTIEVINQIF